MGVKFEGSISPENWFAELIHGPINGPSRLRRILASIRCAQVSFSIFFKIRKTMTYNHTCDGPSMGTRRINTRTPDPTQPDR